MSEADRATPSGELKETSTPSSLVTKGLTLLGFEFSFALGWDFGIRAFKFGFSDLVRGCEVFLSVRGMLFFQYQ